MDQGFVLGQIDAKGFIRRDIGLKPLDIRPQFGQRLVRGLRRRLQRLALRAADSWQIALDNLFFHVCLLLIAIEDESVTRPQIRWKLYIKTRGEGRVFLNECKARFRFAAH